jgi:hypothetical protein
MVAVRRLAGSSDDVSEEGVLVAGSVSELLSIVSRSDGRLSGALPLHDASTGKSAKHIAAHTVFLIFIPSFPLTK